MSRLFAEPAAAWGAYAQACDERAAGCAFASDPAAAGTVSAGAACIVAGVLLLAAACALAPFV